MRKSIIPEQRLIIATGRSFEDLKGIQALLNITPDTCNAIVTEDITCITEHPQFGEY